MHPMDMPHAGGSRRQASLSIIIPTYQEAGQIGRLIASSLHQWAELTS